MGSVRKKLGRRFTKWSGQFRRSVKTVLIPKDLRDVGTRVKDGNAEDVVLPIIPMRSPRLSPKLWRPRAFRSNQPMLLSCGPCFSRRSQTTKSRKSRRGTFIVALYKERTLEILDTAA